MRKLLCLMLGVSLIGAMIVVAGCGGGGGGLSTLLGAAFVIAIVATTGGAGGVGSVPFAAAVRGQAAGAISITAEKLQFRITPYTNGTAGTPIFVDVATSTSNTQVIGTASLPIAGSEYLVELVRGNNAIPMLKGMLVDKSLAEGDVVPMTVNASTTAGALVFSQWQENNRVNNSYENFLEHLTPNGIASITTLGATIQNTFWANADNLDNALLSSFDNAADSAAALVTNVFSNEALHGWWLLDPSGNNEYAAFHADLNGHVTHTSMFGFSSGNYSVLSTGRLQMQLLTPETTINVTATMTSETAATYEARNHLDALEETGAATKVSNNSVCAGTWNGTAQNGASMDQFTVVIDPNGFIQEFYGPQPDSLPAFVAGNGFVVSEGGKVAGYARFADHDAIQVRFFGTLSGTTFNGTIESTSTNPQAEIPSGTITMTKAAAQQP